MAHVGSDGVPRNVQFGRDLWLRQVGRQEHHVTEVHAAPAPAEEQIDRTLAPATTCGNGP
jgi:hypothetical protein